LPFSFPGRELAGGQSFMAGQSRAVGSAEQCVLIRKASPAYAEVCGKICFEAFRTIANQHNFASGFSQC
jgi:hypothetical protein